MNAINVPAALRVAWKDMKILRKERGALTLLFVLPMVFILAVTGWASVGSAADEYLIPLPLVNLDPEGGASQALIDALSQAGGIQVELYDEAREIQRQFKIGGWILGLFIGLIIVIKLVNLTVIRKPIEYTADNGNCLSCGRCFSYCPVGREDVDLTTITFKSS